MMLDAVFAAAPEAMIVVDATGTIRLANRRAEELFSYAPDALVGRSVDTLVPAALAGRHGRHRDRYDAAPRTRPMGEDIDLRGRRADGSEFPIDVALGPTEVEGERFVVAIVRDITTRKLRQDRLRYLSEHDALTDVLNRRGFDRQLAQAFAQVRRHKVETALLLVDLDRFKLVNDRLGHLEGDRLLRSIVRAVRERLRAGDTIARLGGDELALILPFVSRPAAAALAEELLAVVRDAARVATDDGVAVSASIGVVGLGDHPGLDATEALAAADAAMYEAKRAGGDAVHVAERATTPGGAQAARGELRTSVRDTAVGTPTADS
jgi:diguanylate cyclase (GGDEF)-like protein/PAS domain S-box-containing protein